MFDTAGSRLNFPVVAGVEETFRVSFWVGESGVNVLGATFQAACYMAHGENRGELVAVLPVEHASAENKVLLTVPELEHGHYDWELRATDSEGKESRLLYGTLSVLNAAEVTRLVDEAEESSLRELTIQIGAGYAAPLVLRWQASSTTAGLVDAAAKYAERAEAAVKRLEDVEAAVQEFRVFVANWHDSVQSVLVMNPVTGTIWVGGRDTGQPYRGEDGKAPRVNAYGNWETYDGHQWNDIGVRAFGRDGVDGDSMRHIMLDSEDDLPASAERGVVYITPKPDGGYNMWIWVENLGWLNSRTDTYGYASSDNVGMVKLATDYPVTDGAPVGFNAQKQAMVPSMTTSVAGSAKVSTSSEMSVARKDGIIGKNANGQLMARRARPGQPGVMEPSRTDGLARVLAVGIVPDGTVVDGIDRSGQTGCTRAQADTYGMVKVAFVSTNEACNDIEWNVPVGIRDDMTETVEGTTDSWYRGANGMLFVPLTVGGALHWVSTGQKNKDGRLYSTGGALDLIVSAQFATAGGLQLNPATNNLLAGVYLAESSADERPAAVLPASLSISKKEADERYKTVEAAKSDHDALSGRIDGCVKKTESWNGEVYLTLSEYQALKVRDPKIAYNILED